ncbi:MAG: hypothetical protein WEE20_15090 [Bacteroidota bacterium]
MNSGQMMLVVGAFTMLSILALSFNRTMFNSMTLGLEMEATLNAISIASSMVDEIMSKDFDEEVTGGRRAYDFTDVTLPANLGPDTGESISGTDSSYWNGSAFTDFASKLTFNDIDDYNGYTRRVRDPRLGIFTVLDSVHYCDETTPSTTLGTRTFFKQVTVYVSHPNLPKASMDDEESLPLIIRDLAIYRRFF